MNKKNVLSKRFWVVVSVLCIILIILVVLGFSAFFHRNKKVIREEENGGDIVLNYASSFAGIKLENALPVSDSVAMKGLEEGSYLDFSIDTSLDSATSIDYEIAIVKDSSFSTIPDEEIRVYLEQEQSGSYESVFDAKKFVPLKRETEYGSPVGSMVLFHLKKTRNSTDRYRLRIWLSSESLLPAGNYRVDVLVNGLSK